MTGFEYIAAIGMLYEGQFENGLRCIQNIRDRYDGTKRNPYSEAEAGHHYARAMASWSAIPALSGFQYSAVKKELKIDRMEGSNFWATGYAYGTISFTAEKKATVNVIGGKLEIETLVVNDEGTARLKKPVTLQNGDSYIFEYK